MTPESIEGYVEGLKERLIHGYNLKDDVFFNEVLEEMAKTLRGACSSLEHIQMAWEQDERRRQAGPNYAAMAALPSILDECGEDLKTMPGFQCTLRRGHDGPHGNCSPSHWLSLPAPPAPESRTP